MKTFYFNTGVRRIIPNGKYSDSAKPAGLSAGQIWRNGTKQIPFDCEDVPDNATFMFACNNPEPSSKGVIVKELNNTTLMSKYAHFRSNK